MLGKKKLRKFSNRFGINFVGGTCRGNTEHRYDLRDDKNINYLFYLSKPSLLYKQTVPGKNEFALL